MTHSELEQFLLGFEGSTVRQDKERKLRIFEIDFKELNSIWQNKLKDETLGDFDRTTGENIIKRIEREGDESAIFAIIHDDSRPLQIDMKTGRQLSKLLRDRNESVVPSKLMNEKEWNMIIGFGQISSSEMIDLLRLSYRIVSER